MLGNPWNCVLMNQTVISIHSRVLQMIAWPESWVLQDPSRTETMCQKTMESSSSAGLDKRHISPQELICCSWVRVSGWLINLLTGVSLPPSVLRGFGKVKIDTVPGAVQKGSLQFTRKGKTKETLIAITLRVLQHRSKLVGNHAACPVLSGPSAGLIGSTLVGLWENLENMAFGAQFYVESWGWHIINSCMQVNTVFI